MTILATSRSQVWPRFGHAVEYRGERYRIAATQQAPVRGFILRPITVDDARADILVPFTEWRGFRWDAVAEHWRAAA